MRQQTPSFDLRGIGDHNSIAFARRVHRSGILPPSGLDTVEVSFQGLQPGGFLTIEDLATLTLMVRQIAERGIHVNVRWPRSNKGHPSRLQAVLERIQFAELFDPRTTSGAWVRNVSITGRTKPTAARLLDPSTAHYIPMRWFDVRSFAVDPASDLWVARPEVPTWASRDLSQLLQTQGFLDGEAIDLLVHVLFMEIAWNVILHSTDAPGDGYGLFCAQVLHPSTSNQLAQPQLTFCLADLGRGIPAALGTVYDAFPDKARRYHEVHDATRPSGIVRFALDRDTSSRPRHASAVDAEGCRGLAYVVNAIKGRGVLRLRSTGGAVTVFADKTGAKAELSDDLHDSPLPGTQVVGVLNAHLPARQHQKPPARGSALISTDVVHVVDPSGTLDKLKSPESASQIAARLPASHDSVQVMDIGFAEITARQVEYLCKSLARTFPSDVFILWNIRIEWALLQGLQEWLRARRKGGATVLFVAVASWDDGIVLGVDPSERDLVAKRLERALDWIHLTDPYVLPSGDQLGYTITINPDDCLAISRKVNSSVLRQGFDDRDEDNGYYVGRIHLLSGAVVEKYFSFARNVNGKKANLERWLRTAKTALQSVLLSQNGNANGEVVLLGFTVTVREVLARLGREARDDTRAFVVLSYDLPSTDELRSVVHRGDRVVLVTDVISSASSACGLAETVQKLEASPVAIIAAVDARRGPDFGSPVLDLGNRKVPLYSCALAEIREGSDPPQRVLFDDEFWVDPVSLVPARLRSELWDIPQGVSRRIAFTLDAISEASAAKCGHCVDGTRHMSTYVDLRRLLAPAFPAVADYVKHAIQDVLLARGWSNFLPTHVVFPAGISRIEALSSESQSTEFCPGVTVYGTAVRAYVTLLRSLWPEMQEVEVLRAFDPGGNSRCARVVETLQNAAMLPGDVIIADDGMWSGRTISSLLRGVVEAGARRVLIAPMLTRLRQTDLVYWESFRSVTGGCRPEEVPVCFFFPLVYPVPAYSSQECPFEITARRVSEKVAAIKPLAGVGNRFANELQARTPAEIPFRGKAFTDVWARLRCYLELASESESALEQAMKIVQARTQPEERYALLELLLGEWQLAGRSRIRQAFTPAIRRLGTELALDPGTEPPLRLLACSVLRSLFPMHFPDLVEDTARFAAKDVALLERSLFHIATLDDTLRAAHGCQRFLERVSRIDADVLDQLDPSLLERYREMIVFARRSLLHDQLDGHNVLGPATSLTTRASQLFALISEDRFVQHELRPTLNTLDTGRRNLATCSQKTWVEHHKKWRDKLEPFVCEHFLPHIQSLQEVLLRAATPQYDFVTADAEYFVTQRHEATPNLASDIALMRFGLEYLSVKPLALMVDTTCEAARRIWRAICGDKWTIQAGVESLRSHATANIGDLCILGRMLLELRITSVREFLQGLTEAAAGVLASRGANQDVAIRRPSDLPEDDHLFLPRDIVSDAIMHITANLAKYAFPAASEVGRRGRVEIVVSPGSSADGDRLLSVTVRDNGLAPQEPVLQGFAGKTLNTAMDIFGGKLSVPTRSGLSDWSTEQHLETRVW